VTRLLDLLLRKQGYATIDALAQTLDLRPAAVRHEIERLRQAGCIVQSHPQQGIMLGRSDLSVWRDYLHWRDGSDSLRRIEIYQSINSTQDAMRRLIKSYGPAADRAVTVADEQTAGRGRLGRSWLSPAGAGVMLSWAVKDDNAHPMSADGLMLVAAVAVARTIERVTTPRSLEVRIKWPNDILIDDKKLAGILVERVVENGASFSIVGIGINVHLRPEQIADDLPDAEQTTTSLAMSGHHVDRLLVLAQTIRELDASLDDLPIETIVEQWRARSHIMHQRIRLQTNGSTIVGCVVDIDPFEGLVVRTDAGNLVLAPGRTTTIL